MMEITHSQAIVRKVLSGLSGVIGLYPEFFPWLRLPLFSSDLLLSRDLSGPWTGYGKKQHSLVAGFIQKPA
jgi:hypothetical protein